MGPEDPLEDVAEQRTPALADDGGDDDDAREPQPADELPWDADPADVAEQRRAAPLDERD